MARPPAINPRTMISARIDPDTLHKVRTLMANPTTGRPKYSSISDLINRLLLDYVLKETKARQPQEPTTNV